MEPSNEAMGAAAAGMSIGMILFLVALSVFFIYCWWRIFEKAGKPGWAAIVPIYNYIIAAEAAGKPGWWGIMMLIPFVNIVFGIMIYHGISTKFGQGAGFTVGLVLLNFIFVPMLAFGDYTYDNSGSDAAMAS